MEIQRVQGSTAKVFLKRVDEPPVASHLAETAVDLVDSWSQAPRLAPALASGLAVSQALGKMLGAAGADTWVHLGVVVAGGVSAAAVGGYFGPTLARKVEQLGQKISPKIGVDPHIGGVLSRTGFKVATLAATYALAPGVGQWLMGGESFSLINHATQAFKKGNQERREERLVEISGFEGSVQAGQQVEFGEKGFQKTFLITRMGPG